MVLWYIRYGKGVEMAGTLVHNKDNLEKFGAEFVEVNVWLDEFDKTYENHRQFRHNKQGVERVRELWGDEAADAAINHICLDMGAVPKDSKDYLENYSVWDEARSESFRKMKKERERK